ncbi:MAG TPA: hypothetical protein VEB86_09640 [Chryseosolibacter sp.]|nr:hypothetical protein [Chryseosolibacter sp.]
MKKLVFALCMFFGAVVVVNAQDTTSTPSPTDPTSTQSPAESPTQDQGRVKIKSQDLPDAVKSSLESQEYRGWLVNSAYKMESSSDANVSGGTPTDTTAVSGNTGDVASAGQEVYIVELKNGAQTKTVRFDKDGKKLEDEGMEDDQK